MEWGYRGQHQVHSLDATLREPFGSCAGNADIRSSTAQRHSPTRARSRSDRFRHSRPIRPRHDAIAPSEETIADLASASPAFSFVPPTSPTAGVKDLNPSQPVNPVVDLRCTIDLSDLSRSLPVIPGTAVVAGPTRSTMAASAVAAFAVGAVAMASVVQFHDPDTPHRRSCHTRHSSWHSPLQCSCCCLRHAPSHASTD